MAQIIWWNSLNWQQIRIEPRCRLAKSRCSSDNAWKLAEEDVSHGTNENHDDPAVVQWIIIWQIVGATLLWQFMTLCHEHLCSPFLFSTKLLTAYIFLPLSLHPSFFLSLSYTHTHTLSLSYTHTRSFSFLHAHTRSFSFLPPTHTLFLSCTHTRTLSQSFSPSLSVPQRIISFRIFRFLPFVIENKQPLNKMQTKKMSPFFFPDKIRAIFQPIQKFLSHAIEWISRWKENLHNDKGESHISFGLCQQGWNY